MAPGRNVRRSAVGSAVGVHVMIVTWYIRSNGIYIPNCKVIVTQNTPPQSIAMTSPSPCPTHTRKLLLFGDSITEFAFGTEPFSLGAALCSTYARRLDVLHRGYAGYNSRWARPVLRDILAAHAPGDIAVATLFFGANDACTGSPQAVPLPEFTENMRGLVQQLRAHGARPVLVGLGLFDREMWERAKPEQLARGFVRSSARQAEYDAALRQLAQDERVPFVDLQRLFTEHGGADYRVLLADGLHFSAEGYRIWYDELLAVIARECPECHPDNMQQRYPLWGDCLPDGSNI